MSKVILDMAMSLDGYIDDDGLYGWYFAPAAPSQAVIQELISDIGAMIMGRATFEEGNVDGGFAHDPYTLHRFVLTHQPPTAPVVGPKSFTFVTDGIESALRQARAAAGDKLVCISGGASVAQQYLNAGLIDELQLHIVPLVVGRGRRLLDVNAPLPLSVLRLVDSVGVTHVKYRVG